MDDAYVIGIRLALDNGVSAGIATISRELAALDGAIATTTAHLQRLEKVAATAAAIDRPLPPTPALRPPGEPAVAPPSDVVTGGVAQPGQRQQAVAAGALPSPGSPVSQTANAPQSRRSSAVPPAMPEGTGRKSAANGDGVAGNGTPMPAMPPAAPVSTAPSPAPELRHPSVPPSDAAGSPVPPPASLPLAPPRAAAPGVPSTNPAVRPPAPPSAPPLPQLVAPPPSPARRSMPARPDAEPQAPAVAPLQRGTPSAASAATRPPAALQPPPAWLPAVRSQQAGPPSPSVAPGLPAVPVAPPRREAEAAGPTHGDVYLDGNRVGSWMSDRLARGVTRPQSGGTGVDPTLTPAWPGSLQGY